LGFGFSSSDASSSFFTLLARFWTISDQMSIRRAGSYLFGLLVIILLTILVCLLLLSASLLLGRRGIRSLFLLFSGLFGLDGALGNVFRVDWPSAMFTRTPDSPCPTSHALSTLA
jgi:hypothetical protein